MLDRCERAAEQEGSSDAAHDRRCELIQKALQMLADPATGYLPSAMMDARAARVTDIRMVRLRGNHHLHLEHAPTVAGEILRFAV